jgi:hypothetical protein
MFAAKPNAKSGVQIIPLIFGVLSIVFTSIYQSQRDGMQPQWLSRFVQRHLDSIAATGVLMAFLGLLFSLGLLRMQPKTRAYKIGIIVLVCGLIWNLFFLSL